MFLSVAVISRIAGHHSQQIDSILGYEYGPVAVHRDDMIIR
jgi:glutamate 5-kinase